jgi:putative hydrolase of HD superfamily
MDNNRLRKQIDFIIEIDKLKRVIRQTVLMDCSRQENDAEHSWHLSVMSFLLSEYAEGSDVDILRVFKMVVLHDLVEIDAGDTYCYDAEGIIDQDKRERIAADRIFAILPDDQASECRVLWEEFQERSTPESRFAGALDRFQPLLHNYMTEGFMWKRHSIKKSQVIERNKPIEEGAPLLWEYAKRMIDDAVARGYLAE